MAASVAKYLKSLEARLAAVEGNLGLAPPAAVGAGDAEDEVETPEWLEAYDAFLSADVAAFLATSKDIGGKVGELGAGLGGVLAQVRSILALALVCKKPKPAELFGSPAGKELQKLMKAVGAINPGMDFNNHSKAVMEALPACNWIAVDSMPHSLVEGQKDASAFWLNKIRVAFKGKDDRHAKWCGDFEKLLASLHAYVKTHHKMGLSWKPLGKDIAGAEAPTAAAPAVAAAAAPAAAAGSSDDGAAKVAAAAAGLAAELGKLDQSSGRTAGLRRVTKDMKAKNMKDKPALQPKAKSAAGAAKPAAAKKAAVVKPPKLELVGKRWFCENQTGQVNIDVKVAVQDVYIYNCTGATIFVNGKCNAMQVDKCTKTQVLFDSVISAVSVVDCKRLQMQARGICHGITLDKTDGAQIYLSFAAKHAQLTTSKCSELNFNYPVTEAEDSDWTEHPIPEQFITQLHADGSVSTEVSDLYSG